MLIEVDRWSKLVKTLGLFIVIPSVDVISDVVQAQKLWAGPDQNQTIKYVGYGNLTHFCLLYTSDAADE